MKPLLTSLLVFTPFLAIPPGASSGQEPIDVEPYLQSGQLDSAEQDLSKHLREHPDDETTRFALGVTQFLLSIEHLGQSLNEYGALGSDSRLGRLVPVLRLNIPRSPQPQQADYEDVRAMLQRFVDDLDKAQKTLESIDDPDVKLRLHFGKIRLDFNRDGVGDDDETLWRIYAGLNQGLRLGPDFEPADAEQFVIAFDLGDVYWLRGYCHLLSGMCQVGLAYDEQQLFDAIGHRLFARPANPALNHPALADDDRDWNSNIADAIVAIHRASFPLLEPERMKAARQHFIQVIALSRLSWQAIQAEQDDDAEWVPNAQQTGVIPGVQVTEEMIQGWHVFLDEAEKALAGEILIPHWRFAKGYGVNLKKVFDEPQDFDLVLWAHGAGVLPFTEQGPTTDTQTGNRLNRIFGGQFIGFAFWFN